MQQFESIFKTGENAANADDAVYGDDIFQTGQSNSGNTQGGQQGHVSLESLISKHLSGGNAEAAGNLSNTKVYSEDKQTLHLFELAYRAGQVSPKLTGSQMNHIDTKTPSGLEGLLPTQITRLRVAKKRLTGEITTIEQRLKQFALLQSNANPNQQAATGESGDLALLIKATQDRWAVLKQHESEVDVALSVASRSQNLGLGQWIAQGNKLLTESQSSVQEGLKTIGSSLISLIQPDRNAIAESFNEAKSLQKLLEEHMAQPNSSPDNLVELVTRYDKIVRQLEQRASLTKAKA